jgi:hypothetical protein
MKLSNANTTRTGYTVAEMTIASAVLILLGLVFFRVLQSGLLLFSKNTAVNIAHEEARDGVNRMVRDIHAAVSVPELRNLDITTSPISLPTPNPSPVPVSGNATAPMFAAVSFQNVANGPNYLWKDPGNANLIMIKDNYNVSPGQHLLIPFWGALFEQDIVRATAGGSANHSNVFLANGADTNINPRTVGNAYAITYYTERVAYAVMNGTFTADTNGSYTTAGNWNNHSSNYVWAPPGTPPGHLSSYKNGELHVLKQRYSGSSFYWQDVAVVARNLTTAMPFYTPLNSGGGFNTKYVGIQVTTSDPKSSNRNFLATNMIINTTVDYRTALALTQ